MLSRRIWLAIGVIVVLGVASAWYILITPNNPLTRMFQREISDINARIIIGPYPEERDFELLKRNGVTLVVTLLNPEIPYEANLLEREKGVAAKHGIELRSFPMSSILGQRFGDEYDRSAAGAADAIATAAGKVYLHCYLGMHRIQVVRDLLAKRGVEAGTYTVRKGERTEAAVSLDAAEKHFNAARFQEALAELAKIGAPDLTDSARVLTAWSYYRLNDIPRARAAFLELRQKNPSHAEAPLGLGYCAYRDGDFTTAETEFTKAINAAPQNADAHGGLGLALLRAGKREEARLRLTEAVKLAPTNEELRTAFAQASR